ncbi:urate hydroxylase PuuD [bacterium]|nr:urate hydroxylase PuuD [bacterium]
MGFEISDALQAIFRWLHILSGVLWVGLLYFFNFVYSPFAGLLDSQSKQKIAPELLPRALFWFRWGAVWTWITGILLLTLVFYHGKLVFENPESGWTLPTIIMTCVPFAAVFVYDAIFKSPLGKDNKISGILCFVLIALILFAMETWGNFSYRGYLIHAGTLFGSVMAFNVWYRIWPAQQQILTAVKNGTAPDAKLVALAGGRSRHNTYLSVPLFWTMMNQHSTFASSFKWMGFLVIILLSWHIVWQLYKKAGKVQGF